MGTQTQAGVRPKQINNFSYNSPRTFSFYLDEYCNPKGPKHLKAKTNENQHYDQHYNE